MLVDIWTETVSERRVFKFKLQVMSEVDESWEVLQSSVPDLQRRIIPAAVKLAVWKRDKGACVLCGSTKGLHFDHILPYSRGGTSESAENVQILCMKHNIRKAARIE